MIGSPGFDRDEDDLRDMAGRSYDRGRNPAGSGRQLAAIIASGDRTPRLRSISAPAVVVHGTKDRLVSPSGGRATAKAIPGARLVADRGHGPRPAARRLAADHRRDHRERRPRGAARRGLGDASRARSWSGVPSDVRRTLRTCVR